MSTVSQYYFQRVLVNSGDAENSANFSLKFGEVLEGKYKVHYITIPNTIYSVNETNNMVAMLVGFPILLPIGPFAIPKGNYTGDELAAVLQTSMSAADVTRDYTVTYDSVTSKLTITNITNTDPFGFTSLEDGNTAWKILGVSELGFESLLATATLSYPIFLTSPLSLGIRVKQSPDSGYVTPGRTVRVNTDTKGNFETRGQSYHQGTLIVPLLASANTFNYTSADDFQQFIRFEKGTKTLDIQVVDPLTSEDVDLNRGQWEMLLERMEDNVSKRKKKRIRY